MVDINFSLSLRWLLAWLVLAPSLLAKEVHLFDAERRNTSYREALDSVVPGDTLVCGGISFQVGPRLGTGGTTQIFDLGSGLALRVPKDLGPFSNTETYLDFIAGYEQGATKLEALGIPTVNIHGDLSVLGRCLVVSQFTPRFSAFRLLRYQNTHSTQGLVGPLGEHIPHEEIQLAYQRFLEFLKSTWKVEYVYDLHIDNVLWTTEGWIAADFGAEVTSAVVPTRRRTILSEWKNREMASLLNALESLVMEERLKRWNDGTWNSPVDDSVQKRLQQEGLRERLPHFNKDYFMDLPPEQLNLHSRSTVDAIPRAWFIEKILRPGGLQNYFLKLSEPFQKRLIEGLKNSGDSASSKNNDLAEQLQLLRYQNSDLSCSNLSEGRG